MTGVAGGVRDHVAWVLALRDTTVVAVGAWPESLSVVDESVVAPRRRKMAAFTVIRGDGMRAEQRCGARSSHAVVAAETSRGGALIVPVDVARRTRDVDVRSRKGETGGGVIELRGRRVLCLRRCCDKHCGRCDQRQY